MIYENVTFLLPGEQVSGGGVVVMFKGLELQLEGEEPRILLKGISFINHFFKSVFRQNLDVQVAHRTSESPSLPLRSCVQFSQLLL